jgi:hypothetical protein
MDLDVAVALLVLSQLISIRPQPNPPVLAEPAWDHPETRTGTARRLQLPQQRDHLAGLFLRRARLVASGARYAGGSTEPNFSE